MGVRRYSALALAALFWATGYASTPAHAEHSYLDRLPEDEVVYFVLPDRFENGTPENDRGGIPGDRLDHGFDPTHKGFYHGGDLKGLTARLDYIQKLGATAIWLGPIYKNKPVQGPSGSESAGYHGYWITDFTTIDPHFGTEEEFKTFVDSAHARGIKVYLDIITNHTADVIKLRECHDPNYPEEKQVPGCPYRSKADYPYTTLGDASGAKINDGFLSDTAKHQTVENFEKLTRPDYAYTPYLEDHEKNVKVPAWLNDLRFYHNRGETTFEGENSLYGDFFGLDDLMTEDPRVVAGFIDIFKTWISKYKIDGFRVDTAKHVNPEFWQAFIPAMMDHAKSEGIPNFYVFAESVHFDVASLAAMTHRADFPTALDFPLYSTIGQVLIEKQSPRLLKTLFDGDILYQGGEATARRLPTFIGNHDFGRFGGTLQRKHPEMSAGEQFDRMRLAHALLLFARGVPVIYYGDEQGFTGDGGDQDARENMFASRVDIYNDNTLIGTDATTAKVNFDTRHRLFKAIAAMTKTYHAHETLRRGPQKVRLAEKESGGIFAFSRIDEASGREYLITINTGQEPRDVQVEVDAGSVRWRSVFGNCEARVSAVTSYRVRVAPLDFVICRSRD